MNADTFQFDDLMEFDAVKALSGEPLYKLLDIFINGDVKQFNAFASSNASVFEANSM